jgi:hypothetical protein
MRKSSVQVATVIRSAVAISADWLASIQAENNMQQGPAVSRVKLLGLAAIASKAD